ncbi:MAG: DUF975 family protein [Oscillospiraceae bacterium]|nr:DUF975 family protein [Oscillospiraceae bacterium]
MFEVKTRARILTHGSKTKGVLLLILPAAAFTGLIISVLLFILCSYYPAETVFEGWFFSQTIKNNPAFSVFIKYFFLFCSVLFLLFFSSLRFTLMAYFYYRTDKNQSRPKSFISLKTGAKNFRCGAFLFLIKTAYFALFLLPGAISSAVIYMLVNSRGIPAATLYTGLAVSFIQLIAAIAAAFIFFGRYYMTEYLLYLNPLMSVREAVISSASLMRGKLFSTALFRLQMIPWLALKQVIFILPFALSYSSLLRAVMREKIFAEDKTKVNSPAVSFYINKKSKFF